MRPTNRQFRRHAREAGQPRVVHHARAKPPAEQIRQAAPALAANGDNHGLRWVDFDALSRRTANRSHDELVSIARRIESDAMRDGWVYTDQFRKYARPEFLAPLNAAVAFYPTRAPQHRAAPQAAPQSPLSAFALPPLPRNWNTPKAEPLRPDALALLLQIILEHFPPKQTPNRPFNFG